MKRFIDIAEQTGNTKEGTKEFAFYCTHLDAFETHSENTTWTSSDEFAKDYKGDELERYLRLIPKNWNTNNITDGVFSLLEDRFIELNNIKKENKAKWNYYELDKHRAKESELALIYKRLKEKAK
jgi:hypothetical protein